MTADFFSEADCDIFYRADHPSLRGPPQGISLERANALIKERAQVVYATHGDALYANWNAGRTRDWPASGEVYKETHTALLICITPIARDTPEKLIEDLINLMGEPAHQLGPRSQKLLDRARALKEGGK